MYNRDVCAGPNHGRTDTLPKGQRQWTMGHLVSLTQTVPGVPDMHIVFCSPDCLCDWHGQQQAFAMDNAENEEFAIPGTFRLIWCSPASSTVGMYEDWDELTLHIGDYQKRVLKYIENAEARAGKQFEPPFDA